MGSDQTARSHFLSWILGWGTHNDSLCISVVWFLSDSIPNIPCESQTDENGVVPPRWQQNIEQKLNESVNPKGKINLVLDLLQLLSLPFFIRLASLTALVLLLTSDSSCCSFICVSGPRVHLHPV